MLKKFSVLAIALTASTGFASEHQQKDQLKLVDKAITYQGEKKHIKACETFAKAEEMGYLGDPSNIKDPEHNYAYTLAALEFAKCLDEQPKFAKKYKLDEMNSLIVYTTLNSMYGNKAARGFLEDELKLLNNTAVKIKKMNNEDIINGSRQASLSCAAAQTGYNSIGFTGLDSERKNKSVNQEYVNTGLVLAICNVFHPYYSQSSSRSIALNEAGSILESLYIDFGSNEAKKMLEKVQPLIREAKENY